MSELYGGDQEKLEEAAMWGREWPIERIREVDDPIARDRLLRQNLAVVRIGGTHTLLHQLEGKVSDSQRASLDMAQTPGRETHLVKVPPYDRRLALEVIGPEDGYPVIVYHGMPGSRLNGQGEDQSFVAAGVRKYTYDRPGYGFSSEFPGRRPVNSARDLGAIAVGQNIWRMGLMAGSGGCPHALASAAQLGPIVERVVVLAPTAPLEALGDIWFDGMHPRNTEIYKLAFSDSIHNGNLAISKLNRLWHTLRSSDPDAFFRNNFRTSQEEAALRPATTASASNIDAVQNYRNGYIDDVFGMKDWGFDPKSVEQEVLVVYGGQDEFSPPQHGQWLVDSLPNSTGYFMPDGTHDDVIDQGKRLAIDWLLGRD